MLLHDNFNFTTCDLLAEFRENIDEFFLTYKPAVVWVKLVKQAFESVLIL